MYFEAELSYMTPSLKDNHDNFTYKFCHTLNTHLDNAITVHIFLLLQVLITLFLVITLIFVIALILFRSKTKVLSFSLLLP